MGRDESHLFIGLAPTDRIWIGARQTAYANPYGLFEPGLDIAVLAIEEGPLWPAVVIGGRDIAGTGPDLPGIGRYAGEYVVASRRHWSWDFSLGVGWGRFAGRRGPLHNPLTFRDRHRPITGADARGPRRWFTGERVGVFGGVSWRTPIDGVTLMAEYDGDDRAPDRADDPTVERPLPWNIGLSWRPTGYLDIGLGRVRGDATMFRVTARLGPDELHPPRADPPPSAPGTLSSGGGALLAALPEGLRRDGIPLLDVGDERVEDTIAEARDLGITLRSADYRSGEALAWLDHDPGDPRPLATEIGRTARLLAQHTGPETPWFTVATRPDGLDGVAVTFPRRELARAAANEGSAEELWLKAAVRPAHAVGRPPEWWRTGFSLMVRGATEISLFEHAAGTATRSHVDTTARVSPIPELLAELTTRANLGNTLGGLNSWITANDRSVRGDLPRYADGARINRLFVATRVSPTPEWHLGAEAGVLEEMFAGFGGAASYRPDQSRWSGELAVHRVWKRDPTTVTGIRGDWHRTTGFATIHRDESDGRGGLSLSLGRFLGGDWGGALGYSRRLVRNVTLTARAAWSDGSAETDYRLGGRLDYGLWVTIPLGTLPTLKSLGVPRWVRPRIPAIAETVVRTLGRENAQMLDRPLPLHDGLAAMGYGAFVGSLTDMLD